MNLVYVTGNKGKRLSTIEKFEDQGLKLECFDHDCNEPNINDIEYISKHKAKEAYDLIGRPCFVVDTGFYIEAYPGESGFPGAFPKRAIINNGGVDGLLDKMKTVENRNCIFKDCLTYYDGKEFKTFYGFSAGTLSFEKKGIEQAQAKSDLWYVFVPRNSTKTLAEMTKDERNNRNDGRTSAIGEFITWFKEKENKMVLTKELK